MSRRIRKWERGAADIYMIAIGLLIVAITAIGTSYSLLYGRQALIQQEHYKTALYKLRGFMEEEIARYRFSETYRNDLNWSGSRRQITVELDTPTDRDGEMQMTEAILSREPFQWKDDPLTGDGVDFFMIRAHADWFEPIAPGMPSEDTRQITGPERTIQLVSYFKIPE